MQNFDDFVEQVRDANPIEEVLEESGIHLRGHGRLRTASKHDSMKIRTDHQRIYWYSQNWNGDVFAWVMREKGCEFVGAVELLARRAHIEMPKFQQVNEGEVKRGRATADTFSVAAHVFQRWLLGDEEKKITPDATALEYVRGRGWTDETTRLAMSGFSGRKADWQYKDMKGEFSLYGIDPLSPAAVAVLGFEGDVEAWAQQQDIRNHKDFNEDWIGWKHVYGLMDKPGLIYAHQHKGGVKYLTRRNLPGFDKKKDLETGKMRDDKSFNPNKLLAGPKQPYFNYKHNTKHPLILVEGQGDAITWGQWGHGAMAFCGLLGDIGQMSPEDGERFRRLAGYIKKHPALYLALDEDDAGQEAIRLAGKMLGPKIQIVRMSRTWTREDANPPAAEAASPQISAKSAEYLGGEGNE